MVRLRCSPQLFELLPTKLKMHTNTYMARCINRYLALIKVGLYPPNLAICQTRIKEKTTTTTTSSSTTTTTATTSTTTTTAAAITTTATTTTTTTKKNSQIVCSVRHGVSVFPAIKEKKFPPSSH